tara:strand:+ start:190 stop:837 length:648 start_codon:yes stop_codon:yes gene_type:complete
MGFERKSNVKKDSNIEYESLTEGEHEARLIYVADCGMQLREYKGEVKTPAQQIALCFEVLGSTVKVDDVEQPRIIWSKPFNIFGSMSGLSTEYAMFKAFVPTAQEDTVADWKSVLGNPVNIIIKHFKKDADTTYDNVAGLSSIPSKYRDKVPPAITTDFSIAGCEDEDEPAIKNLFGLAKFIHDKRINGNTSDDKPVAQPVSEHEEFEMNESLPF